MSYQEEEDYTSLSFMQRLERLEAAQNISAPSSQASYNQLERSNRELRLALQRETKRANDLEQANTPSQALRDEATRKEAVRLTRMKDKMIESLRLELNEAREAARSAKTALNVQSGVNADLVKMNDSLRRSQIKLSQEWAGYNKHIVNSWQADSRRVDKIQTFITQQLAASPDAPGATLSVEVRRGYDVRGVIDEANDLNLRRENEKGYTPLQDFLKEIFEKGPDRYIPISSIPAVEGRRPTYYESLSLDK